MQLYTYIAIDLIQLNQLKKKSKQFEKYWFFEILEIERLEKDCYRFVFNVK